MEEKIFIQNDGMYLDHENKEAWFVGRNNNVLHKLNLESMELGYEYNLNSDEENPYRRTPLCYKKDQMIVLFPDKGQNILFYDFEKKLMNEYEIDVRSNIGIGIYCFGEFQGLLWAVSYRMKEIFLIDVRLKKIVKRCPVFSMDEHIETGFESILVGENIFCISRNTNYVSMTNITSGEEKIFELPVKESGFNTIYYDGERFWLSSMKGSIYTWDISHNKIEQIFQSSGTKCRSIRVGDMVCFLPFNLSGDLCDELLCCKTGEKRCFSFEINGQRKEGIYTFEYVKNNSIIGINHSENGFITEIDIYNGKRSMVYFNAFEKYFEEKKIDEVKSHMKERNMFYEYDKFDITLFLRVL